MIMVKFAMLVLLNTLASGCTSVVSQDVDSAALARVSGVTEYHFGISTIVALGRFAGTADQSDSTPLLDNRQVEVTFEIDEAFKGLDEGAGSIVILIPIDMLVYPGEQISRYSKRRNVYSGLREDIAEIDAQWEQLSNEDAVGSEDSSRREKFDALRIRRMSLLSEIFQYVGTVGGTRVIDGESFYDRGRWIDDEQRYLIFLTPGPDGTYAIDPVESSSLIYMDDEIEAVIAELRRTKACCHAFCRKAQKPRHHTFTTDQGR